MPTSSPVHGEPELRGVGVGAWGPPAAGEGMDLDSVTDIAGAGDGARSGVGGLQPSAIDPLLSPRTPPRSQYSTSLRNGNWHF